MSELPKDIEQPTVSSVERYEQHFGRLSVQAVLNMMLAYKPQGNLSNPNPQIKTLQNNMESIYTSLLTSSQSESGEIDLTAVDDEALQSISDYLWNLSHLKKFQQLRNIGHQGLQDVSRDTA